MKPLVSVIVPLYNYEKYIGYCIESILNQDYPNFEIIIIDDCSTDNSYKIAKSFKSDNVIVKRHGRNKGYSVAKNSGIVRSKGEYVALLDADDMLTKDSVSLRVEALLKDDYDFVQADAFSVYDDISLKECYDNKELESISFPSPYAIHAQTVMVKREVYKKFGLYEETLRSVSDMEMWWRFFGKADAPAERVKRTYLSCPTVYYRYHVKQMTVYRQNKKKYDKKVKSIASSVYDRRLKEGINKNNTRMMED